MNPRGNPRYVILREHNVEPSVTQRIARDRRIFLLVA
jgi:hypothetical protein